MAAFEVLGNKVLSGDVVHMEWCPTMDLIALVTADSQLMVHRPGGWQRLFVHTGFDHPITCLAWRPDGQVLAVGHADGSVTLFGVEEGEQLGMTREHAESLSTFCWVPASPGEHASGAAKADASTSASAKDSPYVCSLAGLFAPLPVLPKQGSAQQYLLEDGTPQRDIALYKLLFEAHSALAFDIAVTADAAARVHLAVHGRFSLGALRIANLPSLEFGATPKVLGVKLAPSLHALTVLVRASAPAFSLLPDGTRQEHAPGTLLLAFRTGQLTRAHLEIRALALSFMQCEALASRARQAIEACQRVWHEAATPLHEKMSILDKELRANGRTEGVSAELLLLLACGVPPMCMHSYIVRELKEQELTRVVKGLGVAASALVQLCVTQVHPALEMLVQRLSHLHGLSKWPYHFAALGLQPARVAAALEAAVSLRASAELMLLSVRKATPELTMFVQWLIRINRQLIDQPPPSAEEMPPLNSKSLGAFLLGMHRQASTRAAAGVATPGTAAGGAAGSSVPLGAFDPVSDLFTDEAPSAYPPAGMPDDGLSALGGLPPTQRLPQAMRTLDVDLANCFSPVAQHVSAGFQLHSCTSLDAATDEVAAADRAEGKEETTTYDLLQLDSPTATGAGGDGGSSNGATPTGGGERSKSGGVASVHGGSHLFLASTPPAGSSIAQHGVQLVLFRARWALQDTVPPSWEVLVLGGGELPLLSARFYKETHLALLHGGGGSATTNKPSTTLSLRSYEELNFAPLRALGGGGSAGGGGAVASLHSRLLAMLEDGELPIVPLGGDTDDDGVAERSRTFARTEALSMALSHARGMASIVTRGRRIVLLDLEEEEGEEEGEEAEEEEEGGEEVSGDEAVDLSEGGAPAGAGAESDDDDDDEGDDMAMDNDEDSESF